MRKSRVLTLLQGAFAQGSTPITLADPALKDCPLVFANQAFEDLTGYPADEAVGRNCRFLQGPDTNQDDVDQLRRALEDMETTTVCLKNYTREGQAFDNLLYMTPLGDEADGLIMGCQFAFNPEVTLAQLEEHSGVVSTALVRAREVLEEAHHTQMRAIEMRAAASFSLARAYIRRSLRDD